MRSELSKFTLRTDTELLKKIRFAADYNARSANREMEVLMKNHVEEFEKNMAGLHLINKLRYSSPLNNEADILRCDDDKSIPVYKFGRRC